MFGIFSQLRLAMDTETYPHDFTTALIPFPVPSEDYAEFYTQDQANYSGDFICISASTPYKEAACEFTRWYIQGGMTPLIKAARYEEWEDFMYGVTPTAEEALKKATERGNALLAE